MREYYFNDKGEKHVAVIETYCARKEKLDEIISFAKSKKKNGERRSLWIYSSNYEKVTPFTIFEDKTETKLDYYPLVVVWTYDGYFGGDSAYRRFGDYEV